MIGFEMKNSLGRKILGVFIFCFVSIVVCGIVPATKRNDIPLVLSKPNCHSSNNIASISAENQSFLPLDWAVFYPFTNVSTAYNKNTSAFVALASFFLKSNIQYNPNAPVPQAQVATSNQFLQNHGINVAPTPQAWVATHTTRSLLRLAINGRSANLLRHCSANTFHSQWQASGLFKSLQFTSKTRSL